MTYIFLQNPQFLPLLRDWRRRSVARIKNVLPPMRHSLRNKYKYMILLNILINPKWRFLARAQSAAAPARTRAIRHLQFCRLLNTARHLPGVIPLDAI